MVKIIAITGTRADYGLLKPVLDRVMNSKRLDLKLIVTRMHNLKKYGSTINEIRRDNFPIAKIVKILKHDNILTALTKEIKEIENYCLKEKPDLFLLQGDRDEQLAGAIVASHLKIPIAHVHGGDISGSYTIDDANRHAITKFSHLHFTASEKSKRRVLQMGEERWRVLCVGAPGLDNLKEISYLSRKELGKKLKLDPDKKWFLAVHHPTPLDKIPTLLQIKPLLKSLSGLNDEKILIYPNSDSGSSAFIEEIEKYQERRGFHIFKNLPRNDYLNLLKVSDLLLGNSSSGILESTYFKIPTINIGNRQKNRECGSNVINSDYDSGSIDKAIKQALSTKFKEICNKSGHPYGQGGAGKKIVTAIEKHVKNDKLLYKEFNHVKSI